MLKRRLIPCILIRDGLLVQSIGFKRYLPIGKPKIAVEYFNRWDVDEIVILDISRNRHDHDTLMELVRHVSAIAYVPVTVGGGIVSLEQVRALLKSGADKTCINSQAVRDPACISKMAREFGSQEVVISIDALEREDGVYEVFIDGGRTPTGLDPADWAQRAQGLGAGEILLNAIHRDGMKTGYDTRLIAKVVEATRIPVIAIGGAGRMEHFAAAVLEGGADAVCAANIFQYVEHSTIQAKAAMQQADVPVRLETAVTYEKTRFHSATGQERAVSPGSNAQGRHHALL